MSVGVSRYAYTSCMSEHVLNMFLSVSSHHTNQRRIRKMISFAAKKNWKNGRPTVPTLAVAIPNTRQHSTKPAMG